jgi:hypothetical protein
MGKHGAVTLTIARIRLEGKMAHDDLVCPPPVSACDHSARCLALSAFHAQPPRRRRPARRAWAGCLLRNGAAMGLEVRAGVRPRTSPSTPAANLPVACRRDGRDDWRPAVLAVARSTTKGEVLDLIVQRRRDKATAVKLMRKLLKKQGFAPEVLVTDKLHSYGAARSEMRLRARVEEAVDSGVEVRDGGKTPRLCKSARSGTPDQTRLNALQLLTKL